MGLEFRQLKGLNLPNLFYTYLMTHGPTTFPSKGCCIYCSAKNVPLSKEHIVPLSIGGFHVIEGASCKECADITGRFEQDVTRELWGDARIAANSPSRRRKLRPTQIKAGYPRQVNVPYSEYPPSFVFYKMSQPGILQSFSPETDISEKWELIMISDEKKLKSFSRQHKTNMTAKFRHVPVSFGRMIAKIGYGHILTQLDIGDFKPLIVPYILGEKTNISYLVGCKDVSDEPIDGIGYKLSTVIEGNVEEAIVVAHVRLLANCHTPTYSVVVGKTSSIENTKKVIEKLGPGELIL